MLLIRSYLATTILTIKKWRVTKKHRKAILRSSTIKFMTSGIAFWLLTILLKKAGTNSTGVSNGVKYLLQRESEVLLVFMAPGPMTILWLTNIKTGRWAASL